MDNLITGALAVIVFTLFVGGLAESIGAPPFIAIVAIVVILFIADFLQSAKEGLRKKK